MNDMPSGLSISSNDPAAKKNGNGENLLDQLVGAFAQMDDTHINAIVQAILPGSLRYDLIAPRVWGDVARLAIPDSVNINNGFFDTTTGEITLEDGCYIGHYCKFIANSKDGKADDIVVKKGARIEAGAMLVGPCVIGENAVIRSGAVVLATDVPAGAVWGGNPAAAL